MKEPLFEHFVVCGLDPGSTLEQPGGFHHGAAGARCYRASVIDHLTRIDSSRKRSKLPPQLPTVCRVLGSM